MLLEIDRLRLSDPLMVADDCVLECTVISEVVIMEA